jgi:23S rRNA-/tRNA-specific pseudouridylate synthase
MPRALPTLAGQEVRETVDQLTGQQWKQDQKAIIDNRKETHYWEVEVPRLVETYSLETCLQQGWLVYNDKDELVINKPPSKR